MFFRVRGNNVQLVKSVKQDDGKAKNVGAGSINLLTGKENLNDDVKLTQEDKAELAAFLDEHKELSISKVSCEPRAWIKRCNNLRMTSRPIG